MRGLLVSGYEGLSEDPKGVAYAVGLWAFCPSNPIRKMNFGQR